MVDSAQAVVTTTNFETHAFENSGEVGYHVTDPESVRRLASHFRRLWVARCDQRMPISRTESGYQKLPKSETPPEVTPLQRGEGQVLWTDGEEHEINAELLGMIRRAEISLDLLTWDSGQLWETEQSELLDAVSEAVDRGVCCRLLVRRRNPVPRARRNAQRFAEIGCEVRADGWNHAKGVIRDGREGLLFSANFCPLQGLGGGIEVGVFLSDPDSIAALSRYFSLCFDAAPASFPAAQTVAQVAQVDNARDRLQTLPGPLICSTDDRRRLDELRHPAVVLHQIAGLGRCVVDASSVVIEIVSTRRGTQLAICEPDDESRRRLQRAYEQSIGSLSFRDVPDGVDVQILGGVS